MADAAESRPRRRRRLAAAVACALLAVAFAVHAALVARTKAATFDEPIHALSAWLIVNRGDFRVNPEHPPLWKYLAGIPLLGVPLRVDLNEPAARNVLGLIERQWFWGTDVLYRTPGNDGVALVARARLAMAVVPLLLGLVVARWAWAIGGPVAAVVATALLAFDPNLLAHAGLVTNDVAATLVFALAGLLTWRLGRRFAWATAAALVLTCAAGAGVKFSCALLAPMVGGPLLIRALAGGAWPTARAGRAIDRRAARGFAVVWLGVAAAVVSVACLWAIYGFRVAPTASGARFNDDWARRLYVYDKLFYESQLGARPTTVAADDRAIRARAAVEPADGAVGLIVDASRYRLLPQALTFGLTYAAAEAIGRPSYLMGVVNWYGTWRYFPIVLLLKTPATTLALVGGTLILAAPWTIRRLRASVEARWTLLCLALPPAIYLGSAMTSPLNLGVRHVLPILPPVYVAIGVAIAALARRRPSIGRAVAGVAVVALAVETTSVCPNYLSFFNRVGGGPRAAIGRLGDSNLDWGQDLSALADWYRLWRRGNPGRAFFLSYFGSVDPHAYGIDYVDTTPGYPFGRTTPTSDLRTPRGGVFAVSATALQGLVNPASAPFMAQVRALEPIEVLNDTIYLYALPPSPADAPADRSAPR